MKAYVLTINRYFNNGRRNYYVENAYRSLENAVQRARDMGFEPLTSIDKAEIEHGFVWASIVKDEGENCQIEAEITKVYFMD